MAAPHGPHGGAPGFARMSQLINHGSHDSGNRRVADEVGVLIRQLPAATWRGQITS